MIYNYIILDDDDICILTKYKDQIKIETKNTYDIKKVNIITSNLTPFPYKHWTIKDIYDQPETIINSLKNRINNNKIILSELDKNIELFKNIQNIIILGCGTSYHSGLFCSHYFKKICNFNTIQVIDGAELNEYDFPKIGKTILILVSQSGETKDLHRCIKIAQNYKILTIGIINVIDSLIAREVDNVIYCNAGYERSVASTKTFTSQIICLSLFAIWFAQINNLNENIRIEMINDLNNLKNNFRNIIYNNEIQDIAIKIKDYNNLFILGKGIDESIAREGSLKIKEISYIHSEAYSTSSLKHGPFALLDENFPTIIINCQNEYTNKVMNCFEEVKSRNSPIILITNNDYNFIKDCHIIKIINNNTFGSLLAIIPLQLLAYYLSINKNINPDIPRNLAKVVTVE
jgi:glucosamine--fructose-6-phosphate aminotransferase (isomerizing)